MRAFEPVHSIELFHVRRFQLSSALGQPRSGEPPGLLPAAVDAVPHRSATRRSAGTRPRRCSRAARRHLAQFGASPTAASAFFCTFTPPGHLPAGPRAGTWPGRPASSTMASMPASRSVRAQQTPVPPRPRSPRRRRAAGHPRPPRAAVGFPPVGPFLGSRARRCPRKVTCDAPGSGTRPRRPQAAACPAMASNGGRSA